MKPHLGSLFLGPAAENADYFERIMLDALRDHVFWRRNFHPEDGPFISEAQKRTEAYDASQARLRQELFSLLSRLKHGAPMFSPRYIGHMTSDVMIASLVGYFAAMLYNPNNISEEASPVTTDLELTVGQQLADLVGYGSRAWGHLTSGGTIANLEALWAVRALKYLPLAASLALHELEGPSPEVTLQDGTVVKLTDLGAWELMNLPTTEILDLRDRLGQQAAWDPVLLEMLSSFSPASMGLPAFNRTVERWFGETPPEPVILVPATKHYSWLKVADILGVGQQQLVELPLDADYRIEPTQLEAILLDLARRRTPVLAMVTVLGSTETGSVDALHRLLATKRQVTERTGLDFYVHVDGAYGGYATAMFRNPQGAWTDGPGLPELAASFRALPDTDSITIDPHKLGYSPYPAGALVFQDRRMRELLNMAAPYVFYDEAETEATTIGRYILEGSKPGAAAAAVWLNHQVLPLDESGYGSLIASTVASARTLREALADFRSGHGFRIIPLNDPDLNLVTFLAVPPDIRSLETLNRFNEALFKRFSVKSERLVFSYDFLLSKTSFDLHRYREGLKRRLDPDLWRLVEPGSSVTVLRSTIMNPFTEDMFEQEGLQPFLHSLDLAMAEVAQGLFETV